MKNELDSSRMTRAVHDLPDDIARLLRQSGLWEAYKARPAYQQNDYVGWIGRAKRPETREKRIGIMLSELRAGRGYMGMKWGENRQ